MRLNIGKECDKKRGPVIPGLSEAELIQDGYGAVTVTLRVEASSPESLPFVQVVRTLRV